MAATHYKLHIFDNTYSNTQDTILPDSVVEVCESYDPNAKRVCIGKRFVDGVRSVVIAMDLWFATEELANAGMLTIIGELVNRTGGHANINEGLADYAEVTGIGSLKNHTVHMSIETVTEI